VNNIKLSKNINCYHLLFIKHLLLLDITIDREKTKLFYYFIALLIFGFLFIFIRFNILAFFKKVKSELNYISVVFFLGVVGWVIITFIYINLYFNGVAFVDSYEFEIDNKKAITIGSGKEDGRHTYLTNRLAVESHLSLRFDANDSNYIGTLELLTDKRKAIVNNVMLKNTSETENSIREDLEIGKKEVEDVREIRVKNGDFIRIGYSNYKIYRDDNKIILNNISLHLYSPINMFYLYTTTTYPDIVIGDRYGVSSTGVGWLWLYTTIIITIFTALIIYILMIIFNFKINKRSKDGIAPIVHPILYFSVFLEFLFLASIINFTIMFFYQFNHYEKGSLFTELIVFSLIFTFLTLGYLFLLKSKRILRDSLISTLLYATLLVIFILFWKEDIYSSSLKYSVPKDMLIFFGEQIFIFSIFVLFINFWAKDKSYLFGLREQMSNSIYFSIFIGSIGLLITTLSLGMAGLIDEGQGMVFIESAKLFTFLIFTLILHNSFHINRSTNLSIIGGLFFFLVVSIYLTKDKGSILQVVVMLGLLYILFKDGFSLNINSKFWKTATPLTIFVIIIVVGYGFYSSVLQHNVRYAMWLEPFKQSIEPSTQYFMYRYEQLARGLFLIKSSGLFSSDFINNDFLPLPAIHTDFIFSFYTNIFGLVGVIALFLALFMISQSFKNSIVEYSKSNNEVYKFIYAINAIFISYMLSYYIINISSVLQIIPLTDVPLPFLTYSKGILVFFIMIYLFVVIFNIKYLQHLKGD
jgi:cell division protein FtsW (lipid II flippase)